MVTPDPKSFRASDVSRARIGKLDAHVGSRPSSLSIGRGLYLSSGDAWDVFSRSDTEAMISSGPGMTDMMISTRLWGQRSGTT